MILLAIDPGSRSPGAAVFAFDRGTLPRGNLQAVTRIRVPDMDECAGARADRAAKLVARWYEPFGAPDVVVYEWPQVYTREKSAGDPNALVGLTAVGAAVAAYVHARAVVTFKPAEWIGQLPKTLDAKPGAKRRRVPTLAESWDTPRARLVARCLSPEERALAEGANHDAIDALGIACKYLGRIDALRVFSGATPG